MACTCKWTVFVANLVLTVLLTLPHSIEQRRNIEYYQRAELTDPLRQLTVNSSTVNSGDL